VRSERARLVVLVSGSGTNLGALLGAAAAADYPAEIVAVGADRNDIGGLDRARTAALPTFVVDPADHADRAIWDRALTDAVSAHRPDWIVSAGFMRILGPILLAAFPNRIVNTHPALLPSFPGAHGVCDALEYGVRVTGATVHLVDAGVDTGPILAQVPVDVRPDDDEETLHERIKVVERTLLVDTIAALAIHGVSISGRKVSIP